MPRLFMYSTEVFVKDHTAFRLKLEKYVLHY
jgi:hypothetical protein